MYETVSRGGKSTCVILDIASLMGPRLKMNEDLLKDIFERSFYYLSIELQILGKENLSSHSIPFLKKVKEIVLFTKTKKWGIHKRIKH